MVRDFAWSGSVESLTESDAQLRVYSRAVNRICELLAEYVEQEISAKAKQ